MYIIYKHNINICLYLIYKYKINTYRILYILYVYIIQIQLQNTFIYWIVIYCIHYIIIYNYIFVYICDSFSCILPIFEFFLLVEGIIVKEIIRNNSVKKKIRKVQLGMNHLPKILPWRLNSSN